MFISKIPIDTVVLKDGEAIDLKGTGDQAVLILPGYNGYCQDVRSLAESVNKMGYRVRVPRYPGHATNGEDFMTTTGEEWLRCAVDAYLELKSTYSRVDLVGFSMGGVIAVIIASHFKVKNLALIAPAVLNSQWTIALTPILKFFIKKMPKGGIDVGSTPDEAVMADEYWSWNHLSTAAELYKLQRYARRCLKTVTSDMLVFASKKDEAVPVEVISYIKKRVNAASFKEVIVENSPHVFIKGPDRVTIEESVTEWLTSI